MNKPYQHFYEFGPFRLLPEERELLHRGESIPLTAKSFELLLYLVQNSNRVLGKDELLKTVWPNVVVEESNLSVNIFALRKALGRNCDDPKYIETLAKKGYRFNAEVKESRQPKKRINSLAVLPLVNSGADAKAEYLSDGITESIINNLSRLPQLHVMARSTVFRYKGREIDPQQVGRELGVRAVLVGKVLLLEDKIIIRVELVNVATGWQIWGEQYGQPTSNILAVQQNISQAVTEQLQLKLTSRQRNSLAKGQTENNEAYRVYLKGRYFLGKRTIEGIKTGLEFFQMACEMDSRYAFAHVGIADCYIMLNSYGELSRDKSLPKAMEALRKALKIDPNLAEAHASSGFVRMYERDWEGAEKEFKHAIRINDDYAAAHHWYATYLKMRGRFDEGFREMRQALKLDPLSLIINAALGSMHYCARQYDQAIAQALETLRLDANFPNANALLGTVYAQKGSYPEAIAALEKALSLTEIPDPALFAMIGHTYAMAGKKREARRVLKELRELSRQKYVEPTCMAIVYAGLKETDAALKWLEKAYDEREFLMSLMATYPLFDNLRADSRFTDLLRRMGLD
jgi:TolB-like protein/Tfp pilus assembly protein PilF